MKSISLTSKRGWRVSMARQVKRAFKYRFYPTDEQAAELSRTFGCVRYVYNWALQLRSEAYTLRGEKIGYPATDRALTALKAGEEAAFLREVSSVPLQQALRHLQTANLGPDGRHDEEADGHRHQVDEGGEVDCNVE